VGMTVYGCGNYPCIYI